MITYDEIEQQLIELVLDERVLSKKNCRGCRSK